MTEDLKPVRCGCGGEAALRESEPDYMHTCLYHYWVECEKCGISTILHDTEAEAIKAWNKAMGRTLESAIDYLHEVGWLQEHDRELTERTAKVKYSQKDTCMECGRTVFRGWIYCPNCGARLEWYVQ